MLTFVSGGRSLTFSTRQPNRLTSVVCPQTCSSVSGFVSSPTTNSRFESWPSVPVSFGRKCSNGTVRWARGFQPMEKAGVCLIADLQLASLKKFAPRGILTHRFRPLFPTTSLNRFKVHALICLHTWNPNCSYYHSIRPNSRQGRDLCRTGQSCHSQARF